MIYKAVIFDLDGTLVNTMYEGRYQLVGKTLESLGFKPTREDINRIWFESGRDAVLKEVFRIEPKLFWEAYEKRDTAELRKKFTKAYDDVSFLKELRSKGYKIGIVSLAPQHVAEVELELINKENFDAIVLTRDDLLIKPKPHPEGLEICLAQLDVNNHEAVYVGDTDTDIIMGKNANVLDVFLDRGEHVLYNIKPSLKICSLYELNKILQ